MNTVLKLAIKTVAFHRKRTVYIFLCIILSVSIITIALSMSNSILSNIDFNKNEREYIATRNMCIIFDAAAVMMSCFTIGTVFSISAQDRIGEIGFFTSIGMSPSQKTVMILFEALIYSAAGVLLGTALGLRIAASFFNSVSNVLSQSIGTELGQFVISASSVCTSILLGVVSVILSAFRPIIQMRKLSVLETVKTGSQINISLKESVLSRIVAKIFGKIGVLAGQNYDNNKGKYRAVSLALSGGTTFFITVHSFFLIPFWYRLDERQSIDGVEEFWYLLIYISAFFMAYFVFVFLFCSIGSVQQNIEQRKSEFAIYKSMGMQNSQLNKMVCIECLFFTWYAVWFGLLGSVIGTYSVISFARIVDLSHYNFHYSIAEFLLFVCLDIITGLVFSLYFCRKVTRLNIIEAIKNGR